MMGVCKFPKLGKGAYVILASTEGPGGSMVAGFTATMPALSHRSSASAIQVQCSLSCHHYSFTVVQSLCLDLEATDSTGNKAVWPSCIVPIS